MYTNADQLPNKMEELKGFIAGREPDVIIVTEVIPKAQEREIPRVRLKLDGFTEFFNFEPETEKLGKKGVRGIAIYVKEWLRPQELNSPSNFDEQLWISLRPNENGDDDILVGGLYRSPSLDEEASVQDLGMALEKILQQKPKKTQLILCGDLNIKGINWEQEVCEPGASRGAHMFLDKVHDLLLYQHVTQPTRYRQGQTSHILDLVFTDSGNIVENVEFFDGLGLSDHIVICFELADSVWDTRKEQIPKLDYRRADYTSIKAEIKKAKLVDQIRNKPTQEAWNMFESMMMGLIDRFVPKKKPPRKKRNLYMTEEALKLRKKKERLWRRYLLTGRDIDYTEFSRCRNMLRNMTRNLKRTFENGLASKLKKNPKAFWAYVSSKVKTSPGIGTLKVGNGKLAETDQDKAHALNSHFVNVFTHEDLSVIPDPDKEYHGEYLSDIVFTKDEVKKKLETLDPGKSTGPDGLHPALLREVAGDISQFLSDLFRKSLDEGKLPDMWKRGNITPLFKNGSRQELGNYRPISLTSVVCKVMERFIRDAVREHLLSNELICPDQHGFLPGRSTSTQLLECLEEWSDILEQGSTVDVLYLDFRKAFDAVPHQRLLRKLHAHGIRGKVLRWIECFLTGREQRVVLQGQTSSWAQVTSGIPQGSVLGPLCFLIFINDLPDAIGSSIKMYADDAKIYGRADTQQDRTKIQEDVEAVERWTKKWQLPLNTKKCKILHLGARNQRHEYTLEGNVIQKTDAEKDLGIIVDKDMKFHLHCATSIKKANRMLGIIKKSFDFLNEANVSLLYKIMIRPIVEYANAVWGPVYKTDQTKLEQVQRRATRLIPSLRHVPYQERLEKLGLHSLFYRRKRGDMISVFKMMTGRTTGRQLFDVFEQGGRTRGHKYKMKKSLARKDIKKHRFAQRVINSWNSLPSSVVEADSVASFKTRLDEYWSSMKYSLD